MPIFQDILHGLRARTYAIIGLAIIALIFVSLISWAIWPPERVWRTLYFPGVINAEVDPERRPLPRGGGRVHQVRLLLDDALLGPVSIDRAPLFPEGSSVNTVMLYRGQLLVDLNRQVLSDSDATVLSLREAAAVLVQMVVQNFPGYRDVILSIEGRQVGEPYFGISEEEIENP